MSSIYDSLLRDCFYALHIVHKRVKRIYRCYTTVQVFCPSLGNFPWCSLLRLSSYLLSHFSSFQFRGQLGGPDDAVLLAWPPEIIWSPSRGYSRCESLTHSFGWSGSFGVDKTRPMRRPWPNRPSPRTEFQCHLLTRFAHCHIFCHQSVPSLVLKWISEILL